ncbi:hypothetical protein [Pseudoxanthomonas sp. JBR18]|uniref:DUF7940 domain-containing protein n=1 Tax=Pseudoxanthomonas sp. JBR18 TaxID=2969308 RepID=UPI0023050D52|nr:hypothetical protein [Pseudoxanthomonas sp. JBR18]WCE04442.1 hypothetical protein PJ250_00060 [Pseudoxanthomonas sp. JBR18]
MRKLKAKLDDKLVPAWKRPWRYWSVMVLAVLGAFPDIYNVLAESDRYAAIPDGAKWGIRILVLAGYVARMWKQPRAER